MSSWNAVHGEGDVKITLILDFQKLVSEIIHSAVIVQAMDGTTDDFQLRRWRRPVPRCRQQRNIVSAADGFFGETQRVLLQATAGKILEKRQKKFHYLKGTKKTEATKATNGTVGCL